MRTYVRRYPQRLGNIMGPSNTIVYVLTYRTCLRTYVGYLWCGERCGLKQGAVVTLGVPEYMVASSVNVCQVAGLLVHDCCHFITKVVPFERTVQVGVVDLHDPCGVPVMVEYKVSMIPAALLDVGTPMNPVRV